MRTPYEIGCATAYRVKRADLLTGGAIGAGLGGLYGLINPEVTREFDPTDPKRKRVIDKNHLRLELRQKARHFCLIRRHRHRLLRRYYCQTNGEVI